MSFTKIIGITGGSCSGKTLLVQKLFETLGTENAAIIKQDDYYFGVKDDQQAKDINFDHPSAIDFDTLTEHIKQLAQGASVEVPKYDFILHTRTTHTTLIEPKPIIIVEGTLILAGSGELKDTIDHKVYFECDEFTRRQRRLKRDLFSRGRTPESVERQFNQFVQPMHEAFVKPSKKYADRVMSQEECTAEILGLTTELIDYCNTSLRIT